ncbi:MAG: nucleoside recognition domain-containing protein, partial [Candidatus Marinimicrobia bacterium]|nr:nucleoside recognition domain-containing protein [Candidatus Neomarinimicrobiota bacterium]
MRGLGITGWIFWLALLAIFVLPFFKKYKFQKIVAAVMLLAGFVWLVNNGMTGDQIFHQISIQVKKFLNLSDLGAEFLFGNLAKDKFFFPESKSWPGFGNQFAFTVLPVIIFFSAFMSILYHLGVMQKVVIAMAKFMKWTLGTSGAETLSCSSNIFVGQTEAPLLIKPFLKNMTNSELMTIMVGGFATIAGGVLAGYIAMGIPAGHLIAA